MKLQVAIGTTDYSLLIFIQDSSSTTGAGLAGLDDTKVDAYYCLMETDNDVTKGDVGIADLAAITDAHSDGGFIEIDAANLPGWYRLDLADALLAAGAWAVGIRVYDAGANNVADLPIEIQLTGFDLLSATVTVGTNNDKTGYSIVAGGFPVGGFAAGAITAAAIATDAIGEAEIADGAINAATFAAGAITATVIATDAIDADALKADAVTQIWDHQVEAQGTYTAQQAMSIILAALAGVTAASGATLKTPDGAANRIAATINASNERTAMTLTPSA